MAVASPHAEGGMPKPPIFDGQEENWQEWSFVMRAYLAGQTQEAAHVLDAAERDDGTDISNANIQNTAGDTATMANRKMKCALVMTVKGSAQAILRSQETNNGAACWRALTRRYEPTTAARAQSILNAILHVANFPSTLAEFEHKLGEWERDVRRYELAAGEHFSASVKKNIFLTEASRRSG